MSVIKLSIRGSKSISIVVSINFLVKFSLIFKNFVKVIMDLKVLAPCGKTFSKRLLFAVFDNGWAGIISKTTAFLCQMLRKVKIILLNCITIINH